MDPSRQSDEPEVRCDANHRVELQSCHIKSSSESGRKRRSAGRLSYSSHTCWRPNCLRTVMNLILILILTPPALASSHIRPVWVSSSPSSWLESAQSQSEAKKISSRSGEVAEPRDPAGRPKWDFFGSEAGKRTRLEDLQLLPESKRQLQAAASSLQPSIVSADAGEQDHERAQDQRRPSSESHGFRLAHVGPAGNFSHEASSLDHLWSGNVGSPLNRSLSNAQVQFDEDQNQPLPIALAADRANNRSQSSQDSRLVGSTGVGLSAAHNFSRRHDNESHLLSNLNPSPEDYHPILLEAQDLEVQPPSGERRRKEVPSRNKTDFYTDDEVLQLLNHTQRNVDTRLELPDSAHYANQSPVANNDKLAPSGFYYLPDGDKWNSHNFASNSDKRLLHASNKLDAFEQDLNFKLLSNPQEARLRPLANWPPEQRPFGKTPRSNVNQNSYLATPTAQSEWPRAASLSYGFSPSHFAAGAPTTPMPAFYQPANRLPPSYGHRQELPTTLAPMNPPGAGFINLLPLNEIPQLRQQLPINRRVPQNQRQQVVKLGETAPGARSTKSILRGYSPIQLLGGGAAGKPIGVRKSILTTLNDKLNNWTGEQQQQQPNVEKLIEQSFFEPPTRSIRVRAPLESGYPAPMFAAPSSGLFLAPSTHVRQPTVAPASSFNRFYGQAGARPSSGARQSIARRPHGSGVQHQGSQQPASFIPVVAVQVTRTSPAPNFKHRQNQEASSLGQQADSTANEIDDYLRNKVGRRQRPNSVSHQLKSMQSDEHEQKWDDSPLGGMPSSSMSSSRTSGQRTRTRAAQNDARWPPHLEEEHQQMGAHGHQETTVKSALFGYLPHQADAPLLQAMQMLQQMPAGKQLPAGGQSHALDARQAELYANQMDRSNQAADAATPLLNHHPFVAGPLAPMSAMGEDGSQPGLALQLQAHNYVQNDIAHPFSGLQSAYAAGEPIDSYGSMAAGSSQAYKPLGLYSTADAASQLQFLQLAPTRQQLAPVSLGAYQNSWAQLAAMGANPLLSVQTGGQQQQAGSSSSLPATLQQQLASLTPAISQEQLMNPSVATPIFFPAGNGVQDAASLESYLNWMKGTNEQQQESTQQSHAGAEAASETANGSESGESEVSQRPNQLNQNKGKKRSGEFFANAGQLLLSALPLLLAPTLGLMFASAQGPVARYHAPNPLDNYPAAPSHYSAQLPLNGLADGLVLNASPTPQLFTPTPLASHTNAFEGSPHTLEDKKNSKFYGAEKLGASAPTTTLAPARSTTSKYRPSNATASLPALTGLQMHTASWRNKTAKTSPKPMTVILTTSQPSQNASQADRNASFSLADLSSSAYGELSYANVRNSSTLSPTILVLEEEEDESGAKPSQQDPPTNATNFNSPNEAYQLIADEQHSARGGVEPGPKIANSTTSTSTTHAPAILYDTGYEGADFDAQFPSLRRVSTSHSPSFSEHALGQQAANTRRPILYLTTVQPQRYVKDKSHYQYAQVALAPATTTAEASEPHAAHAGPKLWSVSDLSIAANTAAVRTQLAGRVRPAATKAPDQEADKLYPVSTWPTLRRRTVSLITSQGNKTLPDSSERYTSGGLHARHQPANQMAVQSGRRNRLGAAAADATGESLESSAKFLQSSSTQLKVNAGPSAAADGLRDNFLVDLARGSLVESDRRARSEPHGRRKRDLADQTNQQQAPTTKRPQARNKSTKRRLKAKKLARVQEAEGAAATLSYPKLAIRPTPQMDDSLEPATNSIDTNGGELDRAGGVRLQKRAEQARRATAPDQSGLDLQEPLRRDASKSKSAIVTAMITHVNTDEDRERDQTDRDDGHSLRDDYEDEPARLPALGNNSSARHQIPSDEESELREQMLAKKMLLDRLATRASASASYDHSRRHPLEEPLNNLQLGGRANMRPIPMDEPANYSVSHIVGRRPRGRKSNSIELNEATKRALAKFGTLLLEDTLQIPGGEQPQPRKRSAHLAKRQRYAAADYEQGSATERYSMRATQAPPLSADLPPSSFDNWSRLHDARSNHSRHDYSPADSTYAQPARPPARQSDYSGPQEAPNEHQPAAILNKQPYRQSYNESFGARVSGLDGAGRAETTLAPVGESAGAGKLGGGGGESPAISRYNDFLLNNFQPNRAPNGALEPISARHLRSNSSGDQLDARHSTYSNYSTSAPAYQPAPGYYPNERYAYPERSSYEGHGHYRDQPGFNHSSAWMRPAPGYPTSRQHDDPYASPPPAPVPSHYARDDQYAPSATYNSQPPPFSSRHHSSSPGWAMGSGRPSAPGYQPVEPATHSPTFGPGHYYQPHFNDHPTPRHPSGSTYAPSAASHGSSHYHSNGHEPASKTADTKAVNEYLKRVQFSDSDRDKLMASYLTCDNLLNDNDHCLERLSCEFSDPQNIEKANKLDRAVSSILLGHILINTYIPNSFKLRLKSASLFGYTQSGKCSKFACSKLTSRINHLGST